MKLIVGLGNPGKKYELTRHNAGFLAVDGLINRFIDAGSAEIVTSEKTTQREWTRLAFGHAESGTRENGDFVKPLTFMNRSGECVREWITNLSHYADFHIQTDLVVVHDDIDLLFGSIRFDWNKSSAGHKGVQNIIDHIKTKEFTRVRIGIRPPLGEPCETEHYVLNRFSKTEQQALQPLFDRCADAFLLFLEGGFAAAQNVMHADATKKTSRGREVLSG